MKLDTAIERCIDRCNLIGEDVDIQKYMYQYKAIRNLPDDQFDEGSHIIDKVIIKER